MGAVDLIIIQFGEQHDLDYVGCFDRGCGHGLGSYQAL